MTRLLAPVLLTATLLFAGLLSGCTSPDGRTPSSPADAIVVSAPDDYSYIEQPDAMARPHLHDYWAGQDRITVMDLEYQGHHPTGSPGSYTMVLAFWYPEDGFVVPQGAGNLTLTVEFESGTADMYQDPVVAWRGPADDAFGESDWGWVAADQGPIRIELGPEDADLPHQMLSGWVFTVGLHPTPAGYRFTGTMRLHVEAERSLPIPLYPGHPDQWNGTSEMSLLDQDGEIGDLYERDSGLCQTLTTNFCPLPIGPDDGRLVPSDASHVEVRLRVDAANAGLQLTYHGANTRTFTALEPTEQSGDLRIYRIDVRGDGDGPYARQSLWEFKVVGSDVAGDRLVEYGSYHIQATVFSAAPLAPEGMA